MTTEHKALKIETVESERALPLYHEYAGQESKAYLYFDLESLEVYVDWKAPSENGISPREHAGELVRFQIPNNLTVNGLNALLRDRELHGFLWAYLNTTNKEAGEVQIGEFLGSVNQHYQEYEALEPISAADFLETDSYNELVGYGQTNESAAKRLVNVGKRQGYFLTEQDIINELERKLDHEAEQQFNE